MDVCHLGLPPWVAAIGNLKKEKKNTLTWNHLALFEVFFCYTHGKKKKKKNLTSF